MNNEAVKLGLSDEDGDDEEDSDEDFELEILKMREMLGVFLLYGAMLVVAAIAFGFEKLSKSKRSKFLVSNRSVSTIWEVTNDTI